ncbi:uncharacterized protein PF3D7_1120000-like isoform X2 [Periplaneta americana]|uniref:uncharacterized protein PF3D7_1120000-like isoform X2 n=1 Tax=Periplaneta americana TaxID=6978 RepID=UPI0037E81C37
MSYYSEEYVDQGHALKSEVKFEEDPAPMSSTVLKREPEEQNVLDEHMTNVKEECVDQSYDVTSELKFEDMETISLTVVKHEPEEQNVLDENMTNVKEEYVDESHDLVSDVKFEDLETVSLTVVKHEPEDQNVLDENMPNVKEECVDQSHDLVSDVKYEDLETVSLTVVKHEPEERNFLDQHVTGIKEEYEDQSQDITSEIEIEEDPMPISFPVVKCEPKEEWSVLHTLKEEPSVEVTAEDNEDFTERLMVIFSPELQMSLKRLSHQNSTVLHMKRRELCVRFPRIQFSREHMKMKSNWNSKFLKYASRIQKN